MRIVIGAAGRREELRSLVSWPRWRQARGQTTRRQVELREMRYDGCPERADVEPGLKMQLEDVHVR